MKNTLKSLILIIFAASTMAASCNKDGKGGGNGYELNATLNNSQGGQVYLDYLTLSAIETIDTAQLAEDGSFSFKGELQQEGIYRVRYTDMASWIVILDNGDKLQGSFNVNDPLSFELTGSKESALLNQIIGKMVTEQQAITELNNQYYAIVNQQGMTQEAVNLKNQMTQRATALEQYFKTFADTTSSPIMRIYAATFINMDNHYDYVEDLLARINEESPSSVYTAELLTKFNEATTRKQQAEMMQGASAKTELGATPPEIVQSTPAGGEIALSSLRGKVVLVDFWASWCKPCRIENPNVVAAYNKFKDKGFTIYSVSLDQNKGKWEQAIQTDGLVWNNHVSDLQGWNNAAAKAWGVSAIPAAFLLDEEGKIVAKNLRGAALEQKLAELLN